LQANELTSELPTGGKHSSAAGVRIAYSRNAAGMRPEGILAAVHFGTDSSASPAPETLSIQVRLAPIGPSQISELWLSRGPITQGHAGRIRFASDADHLFGVIELDEREYGDIAQAAAFAYATIAAFQRQSAFPHLLRMWNYLDNINAGAGDLERYRQFCIGRAQGFAGMTPGAFPAATAIGHQQTTHQLQVFWIAGVGAGQPVENPRQVSAYRYPRLHGPVSPIFARATLAPDRTFLISGTASIVGHSSVHDDDVQAQLDETMRNMATLRSLATDAANGKTLLKVYIRHPEQAQLIADRLAATLPADFKDAEIMYVAADVCRRELLLEIEGVQLPA
jgi:chorismate lyase/3-hydroxybenzoate synthase